MIKDIKVYASSDGDGFEIEWNRTNITPFFYLLKAECKLYNSTEKEHHTQSYPHYKTSIVLNGLEPGSECNLVLFSVYNSATLDPGVTRTGRLPIPSKLYTS